MPFSEQENQIIQGALRRGNTKAETQQALIRFRATGSPVDPKKPVVAPEAEQGFIEDIKTSAGVRADRFGRILQREDTGIVEKGLQLFGQGAGLASDVIEGAVEQVPGVKQAFGAIGKGIEFLSTSEFSPLKQIGDEIGKSKALQEAVTLYDTDQNFRDTVDAVANVARLGGDVALVADAVNFTKNVTNKIKVKVPEVFAGAKVLTEGVIQTPKTVSEVVSITQGLKTRIQTSLASKNVNPQLQTSAERLFLEGTQRLDNPLATYEKYLTQSKRAVTDIKVDPAVSVVGEKIGDAFNKVVKLRRDVGKAMSEELKKVGTIETNTLGAVDDFVKELGDSGVVFDRVTRKVKPITGQTKFAQSDIKLIELYAQQLQGLGTKPTIAELDAFLSRITSEIDVYKSTNNIIGTTNAERIIKGSLSNLRKQFDPITTGNPALKAYSDARASYSDLTNFIQEGSGFLGKITQAGDFARDASLTKSAVQSVLNNGKKDWLLRLEELTGYQAIDDAVLALQAMKDAGDFRGASLLQLLSEGQTPVTKFGVADRIINFGVEKGKRAFIGTPEEQTRLFLQQLQKDLEINTTPSVSPKK